MKANEVSDVTDKYSATACAHGNWTTRGYAKSRINQLAHVVASYYIVMSCMRVCRKQALSRVKYYYYVTTATYSKQQ